MKHQIILNICLSAFFIYLAFHQVNYEELRSALDTFEMAYLLPMVMVSAVIQLVKSYRWREILLPLKPLSLETVYVANCVGFAAINLL
ncbi:MAG: flippase-like domain-containing protein, partial [Nitrospira sp.]|nr:flippase-like domain-containing protein [Nitrospira sp.]